MLYIATFENYLLHFYQYVIMKGQKYLFKLTLLLIFFSNISIVYSQDLTTFSGNDQDSVKNENKTFIQEKINTEKHINEMTRGWEDII